MKKLLLILLCACLLASCTSNPPSPSPSVGENTVTPSAGETEEPPGEPAGEFLNLGDYEMADNIHVDQLGYRSDDPKRAVLPEDGGAFKVVRLSDGAVAYDGEANITVFSPGSDERVRVADFSGVTQAGEYCVVAGDGRSYPFLIGESPYGGLRKAVLDFFHYQKCGVDLEAGVWSHPACHTSAAAVIDASGDETGEEKDVSGGWHDAGDYGRYIVPAAQAVAQLLLGYEFSSGLDPEVLDVVWFEIEWMLKMQDEATGGVYHKVSCRNFDGLDEMPQNETGQLVICPVSATATADFAASMALASRFYPAQKDALMAAAVRAWEWCEQNPDAPGFRNPSRVGTGEYGDGSSKDERFWAACELFAATGEEKYHDYIKSADLFSGLGWNNMGTYGLTAYLFHAGDRADGDLTSRMEDKLRSACKGIMEKYQDDPYGVSLGANYGWGSNMEVGNNAMTLLLGSLLFDDAPGYAQAALEHMHYLLGKNALSKSYISGFGSDPMENPHHRPSVSMKQAVPGMVSGGPNMSLQDNAVKKACEGQPPAMCYIDHIDSYSSNEITIYWNSPVYFVLAVLGL